MGFLHYGFGALHDGWAMKRLGGKLGDDGWVV